MEKRIFIIYTYIMSEENSLLYFDYNATTPITESAIKKINDCLQFNWGNPSSTYPEGVTSKQCIDDARSHLAKLLDCRSEEIIFTSGGTESNNMVIFGIVDYFKQWAHRNNQDPNLKPHVITSDVEHDSVILPLKRLEEIGEIELTLVPALHSGTILLSDIEAAVKTNTSLISIMMANNETGVLMPIAKIGSFLKDLNNGRECLGLIRILFHTDAAQAVGKINLSLKSLGVDYMSIAGHKFYGPKIGCLVASEPGEKTPIFPLMFGGGQERGYRPGTENVPMISGLGEAANVAHKNLYEFQSRMAEMRALLEKKLTEEFGENKITFNCSVSERLPNTTNISFVMEGLTGSQILAKCKHLRASTGSACHSQNKPSSVLIASGVPVQLAKTAIRLTVGRETTANDVDAAVQDLKQAVHSLDINI